MRARFTSSGLGSLAGLSGLALALMVSAGCSEETTLETARFRLLGPPALSADGRCPELFEPASPDLGIADRVRLTYRRTGGGGLLCDVVLPVAGGNRVVAVPESAGPIDLFVELYADLGAGPVLVARGDAANIPLATGGAVDVRVTPVDQFSCAHVHPAVARAFHTLTPLPNGELLIAGGVAARPGSGDDVVDPTSDTGDLYAVGELEIFDPIRRVSRQLSVPGLVPRTLHGAEVINSDPIQVALFGGLTVNGDPEQQPVLRAGAAADPFRIMPADNAVPAPTVIITYDPERLTASAQLIDEDSSPAVMATAWPDGAAGTAAPPLLVGGYTDATATVDALTFEYLAPDTGARDGTGNLVASRVGASVTDLGDNRALVWGGHLSDLVDAATTAGEILRDLDGAPQSQAFTLTPGSATPTARAFHRAVAVAPGRVLIAGGFAVSTGQARGPDPIVAQLVDVGSDVTVSNVDNASSPPVPVGYGELIAVGSGDALLCGGNPATGHPGCPVDTSGLACSVADAHRFRAGSAQLATTGSLQVHRYGHRGATLADGTVVITGGIHAGERIEVIADAEIYDPRSADDDPLADLRPDIVRAAGDVARDAASLEPAAECAIIELDAGQ